MIVVGKRYIIYYTEGKTLSQQMLRKDIMTIADANDKIAEKVAKGYKTVENAVTGGYKKVEDKFVGAFLCKGDETVGAAKERLEKELAERKTKQEAEAKARAEKMAQMRADAEQKTHKA